MDRVTEALQRARTNLPIAPSTAAPAPLPARDARTARAQRVSGLFQTDGGATPQLENLQAIEPVTPSATALSARNVVAFNKADNRTRAYDVLRNHLQTLLKTDKPQVVAVTAPSAGSGVTVTAANLAFSIARAHKQTCVLVDLNTTRTDTGLSSVLEIPAAAEPVEGQEKALNMARVKAGDVSVNVVTPPADADLGAFVEAVRQDLRPDIVLVDLPPMLAGDEAARVLPHADVVLLVLAVGHSTVAELETCKSYLPATARLQVVMNKARGHGM